MKKGQRLWTKEELILAINLYCKLPFGKMHSKNPEVINLADLINRTPGSLAYKLVNFASLDSDLQKRGIIGAVNISKLDKKVWNDFFNNLDYLIIESENILSKLTNKNIEELNNISGENLLEEGREKERIIKIRVNQSLFRKIILSSYNSTCCITGINQPELLIAGHIKPWSIDEKNRLSPKNGILINSLHDKAFENGLMTITTDYKIKISSVILKNKNNKTKEFFNQFNNKQIILPTKFLPDIDFLKYHNKEVFKE